MKNKFEFNPDAKSFIENNEPTLLGLFWAGYWRFMIIVFGVCIMIGIISALFE